MQSLFTRHTKMRYLRIEQCLLDICDGQHCEAALLREIEYVCSVQGVTFDLSYKSLSDRILELYSVDRVRQAMTWLKDKGFLKHLTVQNGAPNIWRLEVDEIDKALAESAGIAPPRENQPLEKPMGTPGKIKGYPSENPEVPLEKSRGPLDNARARTEVPQKTEVTDSPPIPPRGESDENIRIDNWVRKHTAQHGLRFRLSAAQRRQLIEADSPEVRESIQGLLDSAERGTDIAAAVLKAAGCSAYGPRQRTRPTVQFSGRPREYAPRPGRRRVTSTRTKDLLEAMNRGKGTDSVLLGVCTAWKLGSSKSAYWAKQRGVWREDLDALDNWLKSWGHTIIDVCRAEDSNWQPPFEVA